MSKRIFLSNRGLESLTLDEKADYFDRLKRHCIDQQTPKNRLRFLQKIVSSVSPKIRNYKFEIQGENNIPAKGNALFVANHSNAHDFFTTQETFNCIGIQTAFLASNEDISHLIISVFQSCNGVLIDRKDKDSIDYGLFQFASLIANGMSGVIFSESTWNLHPYKPMLPIKVGSAHLAAVLEIPIVPIIYEYVEVPYLCTKESEIYSKCIVRFGKPIYISRTESLILQTDKIQLAMEKNRMDLWDELGTTRLSLADVNSNLYGNHTWLKKFGTSAEFDSRREMQFILSKNGQPIENEFCFDNNGNLIPGIIEKSEKEKYVGTKLG